MPLPLQKSEKEKDYLKKKYLIYGDPKIGKTTIVANLAIDPDKVLFFATEAGHTEQEVYLWHTDDGKLPTNWNHFKQMVKEITSEKNDFKCVAIDTVDNLYMWCASYICNKHSIEHESDLGFGKGYAAIKDELLKVINYLTQQGIGVVFISHKGESEVTKDGRKITIISPTLPSTGKKVITGLCDYILFFHANSEGKRIIITKGTESIQAGDRSGNLPAWMDMDAELLIKNLKGEEK